MRKLSKMGLFAVLICVMLVVSSCTVLDSLIYQKAVEQFEQGLMSDAQEQFAKIENYQDSALYLGYLKALKLADSNQHGNASAHFAALGDFYDSQTLSVYHAALQAELEERYEDSETLYQQIATYHDSAQRMSALPELIKKRDQKKRAELYEDARDLVNTGLNEEAISIFTELSDYEEASKYLMYAKALQLAENGEYELAINSFVSLDDFRDSKLQVPYYRARWAESKQHYEEAEELYRSIATFRDSAEHLANQPDLIAERDFAALRAYILGDTIPEAYELSMEKYNHFQTAENVNALLAYKYRTSDTLMYEDFYLLADDCLDKAMFLPAQRLFELLSEHSYSDSALRVQDVIFAHAQSQMTEGLYEYAEIKLKELVDSGYTAAGEPLNECYYQTALFSEDQFDYAKAYRYYSLAGDYKDCAAKAARFETEYAAAVALIEKGKYTEAAEAFAALYNFKDAAERIPAVHYQHAEVLLLAEEWEAASAAFVRAGEFSNAFTRINEPFYKQAEVSLELNQWEAASEAFSRAGDYLDASSRINEPFYKKAELHLANGEWEAASEAFVRAGSYADASARIYEPFYEQGKALMAKEKYSDALVAFEKASQYADAEEKILMSHYALAEKALERGQYDIAVAEFENAKSYADASLRIQEAYYAKGMQLIAEKKYLEAIPAFTKAYGFSNAAEKILSVHYALGERALASGDYDNAISHFLAAKGYLDADMRIKESSYAKAEKMLADEKIEEALAEFESLSDYADSSLRVQMIYYRFGEQALADKKYDEAAANFGKAGTYSNSANMIKECTYQKALALMHERHYTEALSLLHGLNNYSDSFLNILECQYQLAYTVFIAGDFAEAEKQYNALGTYKDSTTWVKECLYQQAMAAYAQAKYPSAQSIFENLGDYSNSAEYVKACIYGNADAAFARQNYELAKSLFASIPDYHDALERASLCDLNTFKTGDSVFLGHWEQDNNLANGAESIEWIILERNGSNLLLLSKLGLDAQAYASQKTTYWADSEIRSWLNKDFFNHAFSQSEQQQIETTILEDYIQDRLFLLSRAETQTYFTDPSSRLCTPTAYAIANGSNITVSQHSTVKEAGWWWLRNSFGVSTGSMISYMESNNAKGLVRPAMWINYSSSTPKNEAAKSVIYAKAKSALQRNDSQEAQTLLKQILDYRDAQELYDKYFTLNLSEIFGGKTLRFGHWEQDGITSNGSEPITWVVVKVQDDHALLVTQDYIDYQPYHTSKAKITWQDSYIRSWLNDTFLNDAFTAEEKAILIDSVVPPASSSHALTRDKVFLLSTEETAEVIAIFNNTEPMRTPAVETKASSLLISWLRNSGSRSQFKAAIAQWPTLTSTVCTGGRTVTEKHLIMPAVYIDFEQLRLLLAEEN